MPRLIGAAESWGGSAAVTSDYLVRGISRSNHNAALQGDLHFAAANDIFGGVFASSVQVGESDHRSAELSAFLGYAWLAGDRWRAKLLASYYGYPWSGSGSEYNYSEIAFEAAYDEWLDFGLVYSPDTPRYIAGRGLMGVGAKSVEVNARTPWNHRLAATAGLGYSDLSGPGGEGYVFWSAGGILDLAPCSLSVSYVGTTAAAMDLFYGAAARGRWMAAFIWRF